MSTPASPAAPAGPTLVVDDLDAARHFYVHTLGCRPAGIASTGEPSPTRLSLTLHDRPLTLLLRSDVAEAAVADEAAFVLGVDAWCTLSERLRAHRVDVVVEPGRRFATEPGQQCAMRLDDPDGNAIALLGFAREADQLAA